MKQLSRQNNHDNYFKGYRRLINKSNFLFFSDIDEILKV